MVSAVADSLHVIAGALKGELRSLRVTTNTGAFVNVPSLKVMVIVGFAPIPVPFAVTLNVRH